MIEFAEIFLCGLNKNHLTSQNLSEKSLNTLKTISTTAINPRKYFHEKGSINLFSRDISRFRFLVEIYNENLLWILWKAKILFWGISTKSFCSECC